MLAVLLVVLAVAAATGLVRNKAASTSYKTFPIIRNAILMSLAFLTALLPAIVFPQYKALPVTGEHQVATVTFTYVDADRIETFANNRKNRNVNVQFWYPETAEGQYPLVVFSHGANGIKNSNASTFKELASHGYVVCSIEHPYHSLYTKSDTGEMTFISSDYMKEVQDANRDDAYTAEELYNVIQQWMKLRTDDISFVLDTIVKQAASNDVYSIIDTNQIGVFGHSMGAAASVAIGRERGGPDSNTIYAPNRTAEEHFSEVYSVYFEGAKHLSLTDLSLVSPLLTSYLQGGQASIDAYDCLETMNELILRFFDYTLKGDPT